MFFFCRRGKEADELEGEKVAVVVVVVVEDILGCY